MHAARIWPTVAPVVRGMVGGRAEIIYSVKNYSQPTHVSATQPWNLYCSTQQHRRTDYRGCIQHRVGGLNKLLALPFTTAPSSAVTDFTHNENDHAHNVLRSLPAYMKTTIGREGIEGVLPPIDTTTSPPPLPNVDWSIIEPRGVAGSFIALSRQCLNKPMDLSSLEHTRISNALCMALTHISDEQLTGVVAALSLWPHLDSNSDNYVGIWNALDKECVARSNRWKIEQLFVMADLWYTLKLSRICCYTRAMLTTLAHVIPNMAPHQLVQYLFHLNLCRVTPANMSKDVLETTITQAVSQISLDELGVICMGLFKTKTFITSEALVDAILKKLYKSELTNVSSITLSSVLKLLKKSMKHNQSDQLYHLLNHLLPILPRLSLLAQLQVALLGNDSLVFHPRVISTISLNFAENVSTLRLKDIERIMCVLMLYNYIPPEHPDIIKVFAEELRLPGRLEEINRYPRSFLAGVLYMVTLGHFPQDLISTSLQPLMICQARAADSYQDMCRGMLELDTIMEIEAPSNYKGYRLDQETRAEFSQKCYSKCRLPPEFTVPEYAGSPLTHHEKLNLDIEGKLKALLGGNDKVVASFLLPHIQVTDLVYCRDETGQPVGLPESFMSQPRFAVKRPPLQHDDTGALLRWTAVVIGGRNSFVRGTTRVRGQLMMKIRQLETLGYSVTVVPFMDYTRRNMRLKLAVLDKLLVADNNLPRDLNRANVAYITLKARAAYEAEMN